MYEHGISTVMLAEVYGMVDDARRVKIETALARATERILAAQKQPKSNAIYDGGWRYSMKSPDSDISVTGWQMMALRGAANCGAAIPEEALRRDANTSSGRRSPRAGLAISQASRPTRPAPAPASC